MKPAAAVNPWLDVPPPPGRPALFCFPHAGGSAMVFQRWAVRARHCAVCPVELPGRARRLSEELRLDLVDIATEAAIALTAWFDRPFALFGHSMGAFIAFEVARQLAATSGPQPSAVCVSAAAAPGLVDHASKPTSWTDAELIAELRTLNREAAAFLADAELRELLLPIVRADFTAVRRYRCLPGPPLTCPILAFRGAADPEVSVSQLAGWRAYTTGTFAATTFAGDHFFLDTAYPRVLERIELLLRPLPSAADIPFIP